MFNVAGRPIGPECIWAPMLARFQPVIFGFSPAFCCLQLVGPDGGKVMVPCCEDFQTTNQREPSGKIVPQGSCCHVVLRIHTHFLGPVQIGRWPCQLSSYALYTVRVMMSKCGLVPTMHCCNGVSASVISGITVLR